MRTCFYLYLSFSFVINVVNNVNINALSGYVVDDVVDDVVLDDVLDGRTDGQTLLLRCEDASNKLTKKK